MRLSAFGAFAQMLAFAAASMPLAASARELVYRAPSGCPSQADVAAKLEARAPTGRNARIDVSAAKGGFRGDVVLGEGEGRLARSVEARTCGAVVEALALVVALDRDEAVGKDAAPESEPASTVPPPDAPSSSAGGAAPARDEVAPSSSARSRRVETAVGVGASGTAFANGGVLLASPVFVELSGLPSWLPAFRTSFLYSLPTTTTVAGVAPKYDVRPRFQLMAGGIDLCPLHYAPGGSSTFSFVGCAHGELGTLRAEAAGDPESSHSRVWAAAGGLARARAITAGPGTRVFLEIGAGLLAPLVRDRFYFASSDSRTGPAVDGPAPLPPVRVPAVQSMFSVGAGLAW